MRLKFIGALLSHRLRGEGGGASHQRGAAFPSPARAVGLFSPPAGRLYGFTSPLAHQSTKVVFQKLAAQPPTTTLTPKGRMSFSFFRPRINTHTTAAVRAGFYMAGYFMIDLSFTIIVIKISFIYV
jgi:hypothetical protein